MPKVLRIDPTPNSNGLKFTVDARVVESGSKSFASAEAAEGHPVAKAVFAIEGVRAVFMVNDFVTVTKDPAAHFEDMTDALKDAIDSAAP